MRWHSVRFAAVTVSAAIALAAAPVQAADNYPERPIRLMVGFSPGGGVDLTARLLGTELSRILKQPVMVENRTGAGGAIAAEAVARAEPDGYTLLLGNTGSMTINPSLYKKLTYNSRTDFSPIAMVSQSPLLILVSPSSKWKTFADFQGDVQGKKSKVNFGSGGTGSIGHLTGEIMNSRLKATMLHVPYRGGMPAVTDLMSGQVDMVVEGIPLSAPFVQTGKLRALMVTADKRLDTLPNVPTAREAGLDDYAIDVWYALLGPARMPKAIVDRLNDAVNEALKTPELKKKFAEQGAVGIGGKPAQVADLLDSEIKRWSVAVKESGVEGQ
jgi:tripartite-type tricarboxylate transporter receptor subunit TctC